MKQCTLFNFSTKKRKIKGNLYYKPNDFIVHEIDLDKRFNNELKIPNIGIIKGDEKDWVICTLVKNNISTFDVISKLASFLKTNIKEIRYNGLKDTFGVTTQYISIKTPNLLPELSKLKKKKFKRFFLKDFFFSDKPCRIRNLFGNHFKITIRNYEKNKYVHQILKNFGTNQIFPNFYGHQRFGVRQNGHAIGKKLLKKDYESALKLFCTYSKNESKDICSLRKKIKKNWGNWSLCYSLAKNELFNEKQIFKSLNKNPQDYIGALNQTGLTSLLLNSYSSYLYNIVLNKLIIKNYKFTFLPLVGFKTVFKDSLIKKEYLTLLKKEKVSLSDFRNNLYKELSWEGRDKEAFYIIDNFDFTINKNKIILEFSLPMGVYANLFLNNLFKNKLKDKKLE